MADGEYMHQDQDGILCEIQCIHNNNINIHREGQCSEVNSRHQAST